MISVVDASRFVFIYNSPPLSVNNIEPKILLNVIYKTHSKKQIFNKQINLLSYISTLKIYSIILKELFLFNVLKKSYILSPKFYIISSKSYIYIIKFLFPLSNIFKILCCQSIFLSLMVIRYLPGNCHFISRIH